MTAVGLEPTATRLKGACSTTELRGHTYVLALVQAALDTSVVYHCCQGEKGKKSLDAPPPKMVISLQHISHKGGTRMRTDIAHTRLHVYPTEPCTSAPLAVMPS